MSLAEPDKELLGGDGSAQAELGAEPRPASERPRRGDKPPRKRRSSSTRAKAPATGAVLKQKSKVLEVKLSELLTFPAIPAMLAAPDAATQAYMLEHFTRAGPRTAGVLVQASETNPQLRDLLERITAGGSWLAVGVALAVYVVPPTLWVFGMRQPAARLTEFTTLDEAALARIVAEANARAEAEQTAAAEAAARAAEAAADGSPAAPGADPQPAE